MRGRFVFRLRPRYRDQDEGFTLHDVQVILEFFFGSFSEDLTFGQRIGHFFNVIFSLSGGALCGLMINEAAPAMLAWTYDGGDIASGLILFPLAVLWWLFRAVLLFGVPFGLLFHLFSSFPISRWMAYPVIAFLSLWFLDQNFHLRDKHAATQAAAEAAVEAGQRELDQQKLLAEQTRELERLARLRTDLVVQLDAKWRADMAYAGATGKSGEVPPMLKVTPMRQQVQVSNLTDQPLSLRLARAASGADGRIERCEFDGGNGATLGPHESHRFQLFRSGNPPGCMNAPLEFRVGTASHPEPSWWSRSALEDYVPSTPSPNPVLEPSIETLQAEIADLERQLADHDRVARWRAALSKPG